VSKSRDFFGENDWESSGKEKRSDGLRHHNAGFSQHPEIDFCLLGAK
jgi:hypothetical protein